MSVHHPPPASDSRFGTKVPGPPHVLTRSSILRPGGLAAATPSRPRWLSALEFHNRNRRATIASRPVPRVARRCRHRPSAAVSACQPPRPATHHSAAAFAAVPCPSAQPDVWRPGFRAPGLCPALAGKACRSTRTAGRARPRKIPRAKAGPCICTFAPHPGSDRNGRGRRAGHSHLQGARSAPPASGRAEQATKRHQGESQSQTQGRQG